MHVGMTGRRKSDAGSRNLQEFLPAMFAAKIECLSVALGAQRGRFIHHHAANGVGCHRRTTCAKAVKYPERNLPDWIVVVWAQFAARKLPMPDRPSLVGFL